MTAFSPAADDSGMISGEAKEPEDPSALVDTHPGLVDGHALIFLHHFIYHHPAQTSR